jgi:hypothetical protein
MREPHLEQ